MQEIKNEALKSRKQKPAPKRVSNQNSYISKGRTYAQVIRIQEPQVQQESECSVNDMLAKLMVRFDQQDKLMKDLAARITKLESCSNRAATTRK